MKHPCHKKQVPSLKRAEGQIRGIIKMIDDDKYCIDILNQIKAVKSAITSVEGKVLKTHMKECVKDALKSEKTLTIKLMKYSNLEKIISKPKTQIFRYNFEL